MSRTAKTSITILFILVVLSLSLNGLLLWQWWSFQQRVDRALRDFQPVIQEALSQIIADLETFEKTPFEFEIQIQQDFPVQVEIPLDNTVEVPIQTTVPIKQEIKTTVMIDPLRSGLEIPTDVTVPVDIEVPIDLTVPVAIDQSIAISTTVPIDLKVPVSLNVSEMGLANYIERLRTGLVSLEQALSNLE